jgi:hypothetical protein
VVEYLGCMETRMHPRIFWGLVGLLLFVNFVLLSALAWQYRQNVRLRQRFGTTAARNTGSTAAESPYVKLYSEQDFQGEVLTLLAQQAPADQTGVRGDVDFLTTIPPDNGTSGNFNDKASSAVYFLPTGWTVILCQDAHYENTQFRLVGTGRLEKIRDLRDTQPPFNDQASSIRWIQE